MAKIKSRYLDKEFDVNTYESSEGENVVQIISHDALEDIIHNQITADTGLRYDYTDMLVTDTHCVIRCTIVDGAGRRVQAIGESMPGTLETEIAKNYPALMASQRAFDRAVIRYLDFPGKTFSNTEGLEDKSSYSGETSINVSDVAAVEEEVPVQAPIQNPESNDSKPAAETPAKQDSAKPAPAKQEVKIEEKEDKKTEAPAASGGNPGDVIVKIGRYNHTNKTVAQVYAESSGYIKWIIEKYNANTEQEKVIQNACIEYVKLKENK